MLTIAIFATLLIVGLTIQHSMSVIGRDRAYCRAFAERHCLDKAPANVGECIAMIRSGELIK